MKCKSKNCNEKSKTMGFCTKCYAKDYRKNNQDKIKTYRKKRFETNYDHVRNLNRKSQDKKRFGGNREIVLNRDNWECQECGMTQEEHKFLFGEGLTVDHKDKNGIYSKNPNHSLDNLITLCIRCHIRKDTAMVMRERYGDLLEQDDSEYRNPKIRKMVDKYSKELGGIGKGKHKVAKELGLSFWTIDHKYYERKVRNSEDKRK